MCLCFEPHSSLFFFSLPVSLRIFIFEKQNITKNILGFLFAQNTHKIGEKPNTKHSKPPLSNCPSSHKTRAENGILHLYLHQHFTENWRLEATHTSRTSDYRQFRMVKTTLSKRHLHFLQPSSKDCMKNLRVEGIIMIVILGFFQQ